MRDWKKTRIAFAALLFALIAPAALAEESALEKELQPLFKTKWFGVYTNGNQKCGYAKSTFEKKDIDGKAYYVNQMEIKLKINLLGKVQNLEVEECRSYNDKGILVATRTITTTTMDGRVIMATKMDGKYEGTKLTLKTESAGGVTNEVFEVQEENLDEMLAPTRLLKAGKVGESVEIKTFQAMVKKTLVLKITLDRFEERLIGGVKTKVAVTKSSMNGNEMSTDYTTEAGELIETSFAKMFKMRVEDEKTARDITATFDAIRASVIPVEKKLGDPRKVTLLKLRMVGIEKVDILVDDNRQKYMEKGPGAETDQIVMLRATPKPTDTPALPVKTDDPEVAKWLKSTGTMQSDAPELIAKAKEIVGDTKDSFEAACKIQEWVFRNVQKVGVAAMPNSLEVLKTMKGDCTEHSTLFVGLCRAAGIPARQIVGIGYAPEFGGFGYHAWAEVWVGKWVAMDPTWGENLVDATHLKFGLGEDESMLSISQLMGSLQIEVMEVNGKE